MNFYKPAQTISTRQAFGQAILSAAKTNPKIFALSADLSSSCYLTDFIDNFPHRYLNTGVAEQNLVGVSAGLAIQGFLPFACTFGCFFTRAVDQIRQSIVHNQLKIIMVGSHGGISNAQDGASAHALEDLAIFSTFPNMTVLAVSDANQMLQAMPAIIHHHQPIYLRLYRQSLPVFNLPKTRFKIGQANIVKQGTDLTLISTGPMVYHCLQAAKKLENKISVEVIDCHTIKPIDVQTIVNSAQKTKKVLTVEDHSLYGGLGSIVAQVLSQNHPIPVKCLAITKPSTTGSYQDLLKFHHLDTNSIIKTAQKFCALYI